MRVRKSRLRLAGTWMVSRATEEGVKTMVMVKIFFTSIIKLEEGSTLSFKVF